MMNFIVLQRNDEEFILNLDYVVSVKKIKYSVMQFNEEKKRLEETGVKQRTEITLKDSEEPLELNCYDAFYKIYALSKK